MADRIPQDPRLDVLPNHAGPHRAVNCKSVTVHIQVAILYHCNLPIVDLSLQYGCMTIVYRIHLYKYGR